MSSFKKNRSVPKITDIGDTIVNKAEDIAPITIVLCARYFSPPLRQMRSPLHTNFFAAICHPPF